ncbi:ABC transporter permease [Plantactinospora sp. KLBMP9567]|uniref:ABC transporter permease n=1 Tax=Plantactinospora sp. KLBMP9567 TaxID=3085900 RepID=UPI002981BB08|nr:ABC transporter permease [Plantactinospora sp. KLBMP9567]MDW5330279.1 ABC transporter permease [Plantactinospora sp. KLBMP9567]
MTMSDPAGDGTAPAAAVPGAMTAAVPTTVGGSPRRSRSGATLGYGLAGLVVFFGVLEVLPRIGLVSANYLPPTSRIAGALAAEATEPAFWDAVVDTLTSWMLGLAIATAAGIAVGVLISVVPHLRAITASSIEFLRPIPSVALIPLAVLLYGTDLRSTLLLVVYAAFWQVLIQVLYGVQDVDPVADETARSYGLGRWARIRFVLWPTALPYVMTGVRLAAAVALVLAITAELIIGSPGLGSRIAVAQISNAVPAMYALVVVTGLLGVLINIGARLVERRLLSWHQSVRGEVVL